MPGTWGVACVDGKRGGGKRENKGNLKREKEKTADKSKSEIGQVLQLSSAKEEEEEEDLGGVEGREKRTVELAKLAA